mgnify:CR=1 FL=1|jgi:predicted RNase H-like nuclease
MLIFSIALFCDVLARKMLNAHGRRRASSVFNPPSRQALSCSSYEQANASNKALIILSIVQYVVVIQVFVVGIANKNIQVTDAKLYGLHL